MKRYYNLILQDDTDDNVYDESYDNPYSSYEEAAEDAQDWVNDITSSDVYELDSLLSEVEDYCDNFDSFRFKMMDSHKHWDRNSYTCIYACDEDGNKIDCKLTKEKFYNNDPLIEEKKDILQNEAEEFLDIINGSPWDEEERDEYEKSALKQIKKIITKTHKKLNIINKKIEDRHNHQLHITKKSLSDVKKEVAKKKTSVEHTDEKSKNNGR